MVRSILCIILSLVFNDVFAQNDSTKNKQDVSELYFRRGLMKATATISPGRMLQNKANSMYVSGFLEYALSNKYSLRGDVFQFVDATYSDALQLEPLFMNRLYFGAFRHFGKKNLKFYLGAQHGMTFMQYYHSYNQGNKFSVAPSFSLKAGTTFYVWKYFNFFADVTYVNSATRGLMFGSQRMDELIFSAGLGFHLNTIKKVHFIGTPSF